MGGVGKNSEGISNHDENVVVIRFPGLPRVSDRVRQPHGISRRAAMHVSIRGAILSGGYLHLYEVTGRRTAAHLLRNGAQQHLLGFHRQRLPLCRGRTGQSVGSHVFWRRLRRDPEGLIHTMGRRPAVLMAFLLRAESSWANPLTDESPSRGGSLCARHRPTQPGFRIILLGHFPRIGLARLRRSIAAAR